ncbi:MAG: glycoside hydrolase family 20 zincin-like fold domain-containing protein, partial [Mediterranea sp.]|nr:glycoside hydrolase family 20 zincin-like fold domain-containing protein [Mediterranea sp.]
MMKSKLIISAFLFTLLCGCGKTNVVIEVEAGASGRVCFAAGRLKESLLKAGYRVGGRGGKTIRLEVSGDTTLRAEGFRIVTEGNVTTVGGRDGNGVIYGCGELIDHVNGKKNLDFPAYFTDAPEMVLRGACIGLQKTAYLPGHAVYEYPYTPENFPWFYDKEQWIRYLDMMV